MDQLVINPKLTFFLYPKWLFFQLNFGAKSSESDIAFSRYGLHTEDVIIITDR